MTGNFVEYVYTVTVGALRIDLRSPMPIRSDSTSPRSNRRNHLPILDDGGCTRPDGQVENIKIDKRARQHAFNKP